MAPKSRNIFEGFRAFTGQFSTDELSQDLDDYTYVLEDFEIGPLAWMSYSKNFGKSLRNRWEYIADQSHRRHDGKSPFSMISLSKMYAFAPLGRNKGSHLVNRTFVVLISDHQYNGGDFYEEGRALRDFNYNISPMLMQEYGQRVGSEYFVRQLNNNSQPMGQYVDICEYIPHQTGLTLPTLMDYSAGGIFAKRVKFGRYQLTIDAKSRKNPHFDILQMRYRLINSDGVVVLDTLCQALTDSNGVLMPLDSFVINCMVSSRQEMDSVVIDAWVRLNDGIYNATVLTPVPGAPAYLASRGLTTTLPIHYQSKAMILGLVPLTGFLLWIDNQDIANAIISILVALILFGALVLQIRRHSHFKVETKDINIKQIR